MKYIAAYLLAQAGGKAAPTKDDVKAILESVGATVDQSALDAIFAKLDGKDIKELIAEGQSKLSVVGGGAAAAAPAAAAEAASEEKKEDEEQEDATPLAMDDIFGDW